jgi:hypothetical protein
MPLGFNSVSHGPIAFGFFNIQTDLLLLENRFFWAEDFCRAAVARHAAPPDRDFALEFGGWIIDDFSRVGDLHGALSGTRLTGFIGDVYRKWPFPQDRAEFKQDPAGERNRGVVQALLARWARPLNLPVTRAAGSGTVSLAGFVFERLVWEKLIAYVVRGGLPAWRDGVTPGYVTAMIEALQPRI